MTMFKFFQAAIILVSGSCCKTQEHIFYFWFALQHQAFENSDERSNQVIRSRVAEEKFDFRKLSGMGIDLGNYQPILVVLFVFLKVKFWAKPIQRPNTAKVWRIFIWQFLVLSDNSSVWRRVTGFWDRRFSFFSLWSERSLQSRSSIQKSCILSSTNGWKLC